MCFLKRLDALGDIGKQVAVLKLEVMLVNADQDELTCLRNKQDEIKQRKVFTTTIIPADDCNFRCLYCFEKNTPIYMKSSIARKVAARVIEQVSENEITNYNICWFGGEPLLNVPIIAQIAKEINPHFQRTKVKLNQILVTNGYLLNGDIQRKCVENGINAIQITLDGPRGLHDARRPKYDSSKTFDKIVNNIVRMQHEDPDVFVYIRVNLDKQNRDHIECMLSELRQMGLKKDTQITYEPVACYGEKSDEWDANTLSMKEYAAILRRIRELTFGYGFKSVRIPKFRSAACQVTSDTGIIIDADGSVYKCLAQVGQNHSAIGNIMEEPIAKLSSKYPFAAYDPLENKPCMECRYLPLCMGGCPLQRTRKNGTRAEKNYCSSWRYTLKDDIEMLQLGYAKGF